MIEIRGLSVRYGRQPVLPSIDLDIEDGEFLTLLGPSGCGKSTLLRAIGGFVETSAGTISVNGRDVTSQPPERRGLGFVFQSYALFPHLTVAKNVAFGLQAQHISADSLRRRVAEVLEVTGLAAVASRHPSELSGGQQQRVAIARVLATQPNVILMDEPLSNLDAALRSKLRAEIKRLHREHGVTTLYVTHDQEEALALSDRVAVMREGQLLQVGSPAEIYHRPVDERVCRFVGATTSLTPETARRFGHTLKATSLIRPERIRLVAPGHGVEGLVIESTFLGSTTEVRVRVGDDVLRVLTTTDASDGTAVGSTIHCALDRRDLMVFS